MQPVKFQRNSIYHAVVAGGLDAAACNFTYDEVEWRIIHGPSQSYFLIRSDPGKYTTTSVVEESPPWPSESYTWASVPDKVKLWAEEVRRDVDTPDLWAEFRRTQGVLTGAGYEDLENTPFTPDEQAEILEKHGEGRLLGPPAAPITAQRFVDLNLARERAVRALRGTDDIPDELGRARTMHRETMNEYLTTRPDLAAAAGELADLFSPPTAETLVNNACDDLINALGFALIAAEAS